MSDSRLPAASAGGASTWQTLRRVRTPSKQRLIPGRRRAGTVEARSTFLPPTPLRDRPGGRPTRPLEVARAACEAPAPRNPGGLAINRSLLGSGLRYLFTGLTSVAIYVGGAALGHRVLGIDATIANVVAYLIATAYNYTLNFYWSFRTTRSHTEAAWRYLALSGTGVVLNSIYVDVAMRYLGLPLEVAAITFSAAWPLVSFLGMRYWAFR